MKLRWSSPWVLALLLAALVGSWILGTPPSAGSDEPSHIVRGAAVVRGQLDGENIDRSAGLTGFELPAEIAFPDPGCFAFQPDVSAECAAGLDVPDGDAILLTKSARYPIWGHLASGLGTFSPVGDVAYSARLLESLLPMALFGLSLVSALRRGWLRAGGVLIAMTVPVWFLTAVVNPSSYVIAGAFALWTALLSRPLLASRLDRVLMMVGWAAMVLPRSDGMIYAVLVLPLALWFSETSLIEWWRRLGRPGQVMIVVSTCATLAWAFVSTSFSTRPLLITPLVPFVLDGARRVWTADFVRTRSHRVALGAGASALALVGSFVVMSSRREGFDSDVLQLIIGQTGTDLGETVGLVGWLDTPIPASMVMLFLVGLGGLVGIGLLSPTMRELGMASIILFVAIWVSWVLTMVQNDNTGAYWQGRYYLPLLAGIPIVLSTVTIEPWLARRVGRMLGAVSLVVLTVGFAGAMRRWGVGVNGSMMPWRWDTYAAPLPPLVLLGLHGGAAFGLWSWVDQRALTSSLDHPAQTVRSTGAPTGVNVLGYHHVSSGLGHAARQLTASLDAAGVAVTAIDVPATDSPQLRNPDSAPANLHSVTIAVVAATQLPGAWDSQPALRAATGRLIGYWFWELDEAPDEHDYAIGLVDEIWAPTRFIAGAYRRSGKVELAPLELSKSTAEVPAIAAWRRRLIPDGGFLFLVSLDLFSIVERKNPFDAIAAFAQAFGDRPDTAVRLVIKTINGNERPEQLDRVVRAAAVDNRITVLDEHVSSTDLDAMIAAADCFVSLHRSEGLGLQLAAAMWLGTPVIATAYSGNLDFMTDDVAALVPYDLTPVVNGQDAYPDTAEWAAPSVAAAAEWMQRLAADPVLTDDLAERAYRHIAGLPGGEELGRRYWQHLQPDQNS